MTLNNHNLIHRMLKARQAGNNGNGGGNGNAGGGSAAAASATTSVSQAAASASDPAVSSTTSQRSTSVAQPTTTSTSQTSKAVTTTSTSQTPTTTSTSTTSTSSTTSSKSTSVTYKSATATRVTTGSGLVQTSSFANVSPTGANSPGSTISASAVPTAKTSGLGTGAIVGSVAGGLLGIAVLGMIIAFILRRMRRRALEDEDFVTDFRQSAFVTNTPPSMTQHGHTSAAPSISSGGPGMAGQGAFRGGVTGAAASTPVLQERPRYVYGQEPVHNSEPALEDEGSDVAHGAYSTQPQVQQPYNPEAYGSYAAYESQAGYQEATREYQGQQGYNANDYAYEPQQHQGYAGYDYAAASAYADGNAPASGSYNAHDGAYGGM